MSRAFTPRNRRTLDTRMRLRTNFVVSLLFLAACTCLPTYALATGGAPQFLDVELAASSAPRAIAVSGVAPVLVAPSAMRVDPGKTADQALHATDSDGDPLSFSKGFGPSYMTVTTTDPGTGSATGNIHLAPPDLTEVGPTSGSVVASDGVFSDQTVFRIVVLNTSPVLEQPADMSVFEGGSADQTLTATDADGDPLTFRLVSGPAYVTVTTVDPGAGAASGSVRLAPVAGDAGTTFADVGASDGIAEDVKRFAITVARINRPPVLDAVSPMTVISGSEGLQTIQATDPDLEPLTFYLVGGPPYVSVTTTSSDGAGATGVIRLVPTVYDLGPDSAEVGVTDGNLADTQRFLVQVVPVPPMGACGPSGVPQEPSLRRVPEPKFASGFRAFDASLAPQAFELEDIDGDGVEDVVSASNDCGVMILYGSPDGTFGRSVRYDTGGSGSRAVAVADFDGDGALDLAVPNEWYNTFAVLFGAGWGTFRSPVLYQAGTRPVHIAAGDLNRDGRPDLVATDEVTNVVSIFLNAGSGVFGLGGVEAVGVKPCYTEIADFNRDGLLDLATANENSNTISVLLGNGDGTFRPQIQYPTGGNPVSVNVGDLNRDGILDLVVPNFDGTVSTLVGNGDGTFAPRRDLQVGSLPWSVALGDVNADGILDGVAANVGSSTCAVLLGRGDGTFTRGSTFPGGWLARYAELADVNGDGRLDLLLASEGGNTLSVHPGNGDGTFGDHRAAPVGSHPSGLALGDWNRDGRLDLVTTSTDTPALTVRMTRADGTLGSAVSVAAGEPTSVVHAADFNRDGIEDLAVLPLSGNGIVTMRGNGDGSFGPTMLVSGGDRLAQFAAGDVTGDSIPDLVAVDSLGSVLEIFVGDGDGSFAMPARIGAGARVSNVALGDFDGDGVLDAVTANGSDESVSILRGQRGSPLELVAVLPTGGHVTDAALGDLDRDGHPDLIVAGRDRLLSFRGRGDGTFGVAEVAPKLGSGGGIVIGDLNGDTIPDVATAGANFVSVFPGAGDGTLDPYVNLGTGVVPMDLALGDLDGDGRLDLVTADYGDNTASLLLNEGARPQPTVTAPETMSTDEGVALSFAVSGSGGGVGHIALTMAAGSPTGAMFTDNGDNTGTFAWTPNFSQGDPPPSHAYTVTFRGEDEHGGATDAQTAITVNNVNRAPAANAGGPYNGTVGYAVSFDGSGSSDPDGDPLTSAWTFGDGVTGSGPKPSHTYASRAGSPYTVTLTVSDGSLTGTATTTATMQDFFAAKAFYPFNLSYIFPQILPTLVWVEPINGSFAIGDVVLSSVSMSYNGVTILTGCRSTSGGDRNRNGVAELRVCFARNDLRTLFASLPNGTSNVTVTLAGDLTSGGKFQGSTLVHVIKLGFLGSGSLASVSPNPLNPQGRLTFVTTQPGAASVQVFDLNGRLVRTLMAQQSLPPGVHEVTVDGRNEQGNRLASGIYFYRVRSVDGVSKGAFTVLR